MIKFTDLRVSNGHLIISAEVREIEDYYDNVYIDKIKIDSQNTFSSSGPSSSLIYESASFPAETKSITLDLSATDFNDENIGDEDIDMDKTMFFVYAVATGTPSSDTPCGLDNATSLGVTYSLCPIYNETMGYIRQVENTCDIPKDFINMILQLKAIEYSINSGHFIQAIKYYNKFYKNLSGGSTDSCGCHG